MDLSESIDWLKWRFKKCKIIYVDEKDKIAIDRILDFLEYRFENENVAFSNLYIHCLTDFIKKYNTPINNKLPHRELHRVLDQPINVSVQTLTNTANEMEQFRLLGYDSNTPIKHPLLFSEDEKLGCLSRIRVLMQSNNQRKALFGQHWDFQEVKVGLMNQIKNYLDGQKRE